MPTRRHLDHTPAPKGKGKVNPITPDRIKTMAKMAVERRAPAGDMITLPLRLTLTRAHWEALTEAAIRQGKKLELVIEEILKGQGS